MSDVTGAIQAGAAVAGVLGAGLTFLWGRIERINRATKADLRKCEQRASEQSAMGRERRSALYTVVEFLANALQRHDPAAPEIEQSRKVISELRARDSYEADQDHRADQERVG